MSERERIPRVVEKLYSPAELGAMLGFAPGFFRQLAKQGEFTLQAEGDQPGQSVVVCQPYEISGELRIPATAVNAWLARHPYRPDVGVKARNRGELIRRLRPLSGAPAVVA